MTEYTVEVTQLVRVTIDETKFDEAFMEEFRSNFYPFDSLTDHAEHIAQLQARDIIDGGNPKEFIEGYGPAREMGIVAVVESVEMDTVEVRP